MAANTAAANSKGSATDRAADKAHDAVDNAAEIAAAVEEQLRLRAQQLGERRDLAVGAVEQFVKERPVASIGIAFAAGALLCSLLRR